MKKIVKEYGYSIDEQELENIFMQANRKPLTKEIRNFFVSIIPFAIMAYDAGMEGASLSSVLPFIKKDVAKGETA